LFILGIILGVIGLLVLIIAISYNGFARNRDGESSFGAIIGIIVGIILLLLGALFWFLSSFFTQDPGEASVLKSWSGEIVGQETAPGFHWKSPTVDVVTFDIRNQRVVFVGADPNSSGDNSGGSADGIYITVQDAQGVSANIDITVRYSIDPEAIEDIYNDYGNEENLRARLIFNDIRSVVRIAPSRFDTLELLTSRAELQQEIFELLEQKWADDGIIVDDISLQEILYPESVRNAFSDAQNAQIAVQTAQANLERATVDAQVRVAEAQAQADANALLTASLTPQVLQNKYIDAMGAGTIYVVPEGSTPFIGTR
jgi:regulator of protease activity HflC (stomatin/prohibitin superfamily)